MYPPAMGGGAKGEGGARSWDLLDALPIGAIAVDARGVPQYANEAFCALVDRRASELDGERRPWAWWLPADADRLTRLIRAIERGEPVPGEGVQVHLRHRSGRSVPVVVLGSRLDGGGESQPLFLLTVLDISERKRAENQFRESERHLALEAGRTGTWEWTVSTGELRWSDELLAIHGVGAEAFDGTFEAFQRDIHPDDRHWVLDTINRALREERDTYEVTYRIVRPDGEVRWLEARGRVLRDERGAPARMLGVCGDVSERRRAAEVQRILSDASTILPASFDPDVALQQLTDVLVATLADYALAFVRGDDGDIRQAGLSHRERSKVHLVEELAGQMHVSLDHPDGVGAVMRSGTSALVGSAGAHDLDAQARTPRQLQLVRQLGTRSWLLVPLAARGRTFGALVLATTDSSGRRYGEVDRRLAEDLAARASLTIDNARAYQEAKRAIRAREDVMAVVSHDLRVPLQTILSASQVLQTVEMSAERREDSLRCIERAALSMDRLIRDLLDVSRLEAGKLMIELASVEVRSVVEEAVALAAPPAAEKAICIETHADAGLPPVAADRARLLQVLSNLLDNAIKFVPEGGRIEVRAERDPSGVRLAVADSGPGIPAELLPRIFDRFWRATHHEHGAGLGLAIAQGIVEAHGGALEVSSEPGQGATFGFVLREHAPRAEHHVEAEANEAILLIDDDDRFRREVVVALDAAGFRVVTAADGQRGLELARELGRPRLILLDLMMPVMDGWELYEKLRDDPLLFEVPVVVVTSFDRSRAALSLSGASHYLEKPVRLEELLDVVRAHVAGS